MLHSKRFFGLFVLATSCGFVMQTAACGDDAASTPTEDSGAPDANTAADTSAPDTSSPDAADAAKPTPVFLDPSDFSDLFTIDPAFPYGVTGKHAADGTIANGVSWGTTGPIVTSLPSVTSWALPSDPKGAATSTMTTAAVASGVPTGAFYGDFVELPFGPFALQSYTAGGEPFAGEALLYAASFGSIASRGKVNGFYSGVGVTDGTTDTIVYAGESPITGAASATSVNGLYAAPLCAGQLVATNACAASHLLFGWSGYSGPVVADTNGNVFVAAPLMAGGLDLYGLTKAQALSTTTAVQATIGNDSKASGTASVAAIAEKGASTGWFVTVDYSDMTTHVVPPVLGVDYTSSGPTVATGSHAYASVLSPTSTVTGLALFNDNDGDLWIALTAATAGTFFKLEKKP